MNAAPKPLDLWRFPLAMVVFELVSYLSQDMYLPALPVMQRDFAVSRADAQLSVAAWAAGAAVLQLLAGPVSDRFGRRAVLLGGCWLFSSASIACAMSWDFGVFQVARVVQGSAVCCAVAAGYACIHERFPPHTAVRIQAWMSSITVLAPAVGPALGAAFLGVARWQGIFALLGCAALALALMLHRVTPETVDLKQARNLSARRIAGHYRSMLGNAPMMCLLLVFCLVFGVLMAWNVSAPFLVHDMGGGRWGFAVSQVWVCGLFIAGTRYVQVRVAGRTLSELVRSGLRVCAAGMAAACAAAWLCAPAAAVIGLYGAFTFGAGMLLSPLFRAVLDSARQPMGLRMALIASGINAAGSASPALVAWLQPKDWRGFTALVGVGTLLGFSLGASRWGWRALPAAAPGET